jgi:uncharacterized phiE125 gp8 family phage protein
VYVDSLPISKPVRTTAPTLLQEPVTVSEARRQCRIADAISYHDEELAALIAAAREMVENDTGIVCYTGSFTQKFTDWSGVDLADVRPVTSITSITYLDGDGTSQTLSTDVYQLETASVKQFVRLKYGQNWPATRGDTNGITVTYVAGYATVAAVPQMVKLAVLLKLHCEWLLKNELDATTQEEGYVRVVNRLGRRTYP